MITKFKKLMMKGLLKSASLFITPLNSISNYIEESKKAILDAGILCTIFAMSLILCVGLLSAGILSTFVGASLMMLCLRGVVVTAVKKEKK